MGLILLPERNGTAILDGLIQQVQQEQQNCVSPSHFLTPVPCTRQFFGFPPEQQFPPQLQLHKPLESSSLKSADERGGGTNGAPESKLWLLGRRRPYASGYSSSSIGDVMLGVSKHVTPPLIDEGEADELSWCLEINATAVEFLRLKTCLGKFSLSLEQM
jgi:hypothetical protein